MITQLLIIALILSGFWLWCVRPQLVRTVAASNLFEAVAEGNVARLQGMIARGMDAQSWRSRRRATLLMVAAQQGRPEVIGILSRAGVDPNARDDVGRTALHYALQWDREHLESRHASCIAELLRIGINPDTTDHSGMRASDLARRKGLPTTFSPRFDQ